MKILNEYESYVESQAKGRERVCPRPPPHHPATHLLGLLCSFQSSCFIYSLLSPSLSGNGGIARIYPPGFLCVSGHPCHRASGLRKGASGSPVFNCYQPDPPRITEGPQTQHAQNHPPFLPDFGTSVRRVPAALSRRGGSFIDTPV